MLATYSDKTPPQRKFCHLNRDLERIDGTQYRRQKTSCASLSFQPTCTSAELTLLLVCASKAYHETSSGSTSPGSAFALRKERLNCVLQGQPGPCRVLESHAGARQRSPGTVRHARHGECYEFRADQRTLLMVNEERRAHVFRFFFLFFYFCQT